MNILTALDAPDVFAPHFRGGTWRPWRAFLASPPTARQVA